jgi:hypothetical protein
MIVNPTLGSILARLLSLPMTIYTLCANNPHAVYYSEFSVSFISVAIVAVVSMVCLMLLLLIAKCNLLVFCECYACCFKAVSDKSVLEQRIDNLLVVTRNLNARVEALERECGGNRIGV